MIILMKYFKLKLFKILEPESPCCSRELRDNQTIRNLIIEVLKKRGMARKKREAIANEIIKKIPWCEE